MAALNNYIFKKASEISLNVDKLKSGQKVYAIGNGMNHGLGISEGIISLPSTFIKIDEVVREFIQCDLTITNGNSGGALLDSKGRLI